MNLVLDDIINLNVLWCMLIEIQNTHLRRLHWKNLYNFMWDLFTKMQNTLLWCIVLSITDTLILQTEQTVRGIGVSIF